MPGGMPMIGGARPGGWWCPRDTTSKHGEHRACVSYERCAEQPPTWVHSSSNLPTSCSAVPGTGSCPGPCSKSVCARAPRIAVPLLQLRVASLGHQHEQRHPRSSRHAPGPACWAWASGAPVQGPPWCRAWPTPNCCMHSPGFTPTWLEPAGWFRATNSGHPRTAR